MCKQIFVHFQLDKMLLIFLTVLLLFSCKKLDFKMAEAEEKSKLESIPELSNTLKKNIQPESIHYFENSKGRLWIASLTPGTYGLATSKLAVSLKQGRFSMIITSYDYDKSVYNEGDFNTYTGTISVYNQQRKEIFQNYFIKGELQPKKRNSDSTSTASFYIVITEPEPIDGNWWCMVFPPLCDYNNGGTGNNPGDPAMLMTDPGDAGGGGNPGLPQPDPCADAQVGAAKATALSTSSVYDAAKSSIQAAAIDGKEHGVSFGKDANGNIITSNVSSGTGNSGTTNPISNKFADLHNHQSNLPPTSGDLYGFVDIITNSSLFEIRYVITTNGTVYALVVTNPQAAITFNSLYPRQPAINGYEPDFPEDLVDEINFMKFNGASEEMAMVFVLDKYNAGVALLKQNNNGYFKKLGTKEVSDEDGNKTYIANNCP